MKKLGIIILGAVILGIIVALTMVMQVVEVFIGTFLIIMTVFFLGYLYNNVREPLD